MRAIAIRVSSNLGITLYFHHNNMVTVADCSGLSFKCCLDLDKHPVFQTGRDDIGPDTRVTLTDIKNGCFVQV